MKKKIAICEPICKEFSHESFNSAYLVALSEIFKNYELCFFAHQSHIDAMQKNLALRGIELRNLSYEDIDFKDSYFYYGANKKYKKVIEQIQTYLQDQDKKVIFCTSINPLFANLLSKNNYYVISVVHGGLEEFSIDEYVNSLKTKINYRVIVSALLHRKFQNIYREFIRFSTKKRARRLINNKCFSFRKMILDTDIKRFSFILNSEHILNNLEQLIGHRDNLYCIPLFKLSPIKIPQKNHDIPIFAVFGYGANNDLLSKLVEYLKKSIGNKYDYEIKNIGMQNYSDNSKNVHFIQYSKGFLDREDMEYLLSDVDFLLNFYKSSEYKFGCSGSIIEAITYERPVIYTTNDSYNAFNNKYKIGIECENLETICKTVSNIIINWENYKQSDYLYFKENIIKEKDYLSLENSKSRLIKLFKQIEII